jgi:hypothetical protein
MNSATTSKPAGCKPVPLSRRWLRRLIWACVCLVSLLTVYYQWENRRSARELKAAHTRLIERVGTDDPLAFAPPKIPDAQNFFALPTIEKWATEPLDADGRCKAYKIPPNVFLPPGFTVPRLIENEADGTSRIDFSQRSAIELDRLLGDAGGLLTELHNGLARPISCLKPTLPDALEAAKNEIAAAPIPNVGNMSEHLRHLALHLRVAAHAGNSAKTASTALILMRLFPESCANHGSFVSNLVSLAGHNIAFEALQDALSCPVWSEDSLLQLQLQLSKHHDLQLTEDALIRELLWCFATMMQTRESQIRGEAVPLYQTFSLNDATGFSEEWLIEKTMRAMGRGMPIGWLDSNIANYLDRMLDIIGPDTETQWMEAAQRIAAQKQRAAAESPANPRRIIANLAIANIGTLFPTAAETLFHRRCLILACELEKHRLQTGAYPAALPVLSGFETHDPARPTHPPGYRLEEDGYLLWSAGPDATDDGGSRDKDWLWRMKRTP